MVPEASSLGLDHYVRHVLAQYPVPAVDHADVCRKRVHLAFCSFWLSLSEAMSSSYTQVSSRYMVMLHPALVCSHPRPELVSALFKQSMVPYDLVGTNCLYESKGTARPGG